MPLWTLWESFRLKPPQNKTGYKYSNPNSFVIPVIFLLNLSAYIDFVLADFPCCCLVYSVVSKRLLKDADSSH